MRLLRVLVILEAAGVSIADVMADVEAQVVFDLSNVGTNVPLPVYAEPTGKRVAQWKTEQPRRKGKR